MLLQHLQQLGLHGGIHGVDLVQKQRSAVSQFKQTFFGLCTRKAAPLRAEKHTLQQINRDSGTVLGDKGLVLPGTEQVQRLGKEFLSRTGFAIDQGGGIIFCHLFHHALELLHGGILGHNIVQRRLAIMDRPADSPLGNIQKLGNINGPLNRPILSHNGIGGGGHSNFKISGGQHLLLSHGDGPGAQGADHSACLLTELGVNIQQISSPHLPAKIIRQLFQGTAGLIIFDDPVPVDHHHTFHGITVDFQQPGNLTQIFIHARFLLNFHAGKIYSGNSLQ